MRMRFESLICLLPEAFKIASRTREPDPKGNGAIRAVLASGLVEIWTKIRALPDQLAAGRASEQVNVARR